jgi:hypothetical protein
MADSARVSKDALDEAGSCGDHLQSPEWTGEALEYRDLDATMRRLAQTHLGRGRLRWLAEKGLIPLTAEQVVAYLEEHPCEIFDGPTRNKQPIRIAPEPPPPAPPEKTPEPPNPMIETADRTLSLTEAMADFGRRNTE